EFRGRGPPFAPLAPPHGERPRAPHTDAELGQALDAAVEDVLREPARFLVVPCHRFIMAVGDWNYSATPDDPGGVRVLLAVALGVGAVVLTAAPAAADPARPTKLSSHATSIRPPP